MPITLYENFLEEDLYRECLQTAKHLITLGNNLFATNYYWPKSIIKDSAPVLIHGIHEKSLLFQKLKTIVEEKTGLTLRKDNTIMFYYWTRYSYIPWHNDASHEGGLTVYLNEYWDKDNGGLFLYEDENDHQIKAIVPQKNTGMLQQGGVQHATTAVTCTDFRITLQIFFGKEDSVDNSY